MASKRSPLFRPGAQVIVITRHVREALQRWASELEDPAHVGVPMACREWVPLYGAPGVGVIYADASGEEGWAAWTFASGMSSTGEMFSEPFQWEFASPSASDCRPFAVGDRMEQRARRASARRERDLARVHDPSLEESAVAYLAAGVQTTSGGSTQGWVWWRDFMRSLGESPEQHGELADGPEVRLRIEGYYLRFVVLVHGKRRPTRTSRLPSPPPPRRRHR